MYLADSSNFVKTFSFCLLSNGAAGIGALKRKKKKEKGEKKKGQRKRKKKKERKGEK